MTTFGESIINQNFAKCVTVLNFVEQMFAYQIIEKTIDDIFGLHFFSFLAQLVDDKRFYFLQCLVGLRVIQQPISVFHTFESIDKVA